MAFFGKKEDKKESQRLAAQQKVETPPPPPPPRKPTLAIRNFVIGIVAAEKLAAAPDEKLEEGLRSALPEGTLVARAGREGELRLFEVGLTSAFEMAEALGRLMEGGLLGGEIKLAFERSTVICRAEGINATLALAAEPVAPTGLRVTVRSTSSEVHLQYPPAEIHRRWQGDEDYREAYARWRMARVDPSGAWHGDWPVAGEPDEAPPWIKLASREGEVSPEFDEAVLLRFAFQGAETSIMRFNLRVLLNGVTGEAALYRSLPISLESLPRELVARMNREPERFAPLKAPGGFAANYELVRQLYEEAGGEYFHVESPGSPAPEPAPERRMTTPMPSPRPSLPPRPAPAPRSGNVPRPAPRPAPRPISSQAPIATATESGDGEVTGGGE